MKWTQINASKANAKQDKLNFFDLWVYRVLYELGALKKCSDTRSWGEDREILINLLCISENEMCELESDDYEPRLWKKMRNAFVQAKKKSRFDSIYEVVPVDLGQNVRQIRETLELTEVEELILVFFIMSKIYRPLTWATELIDSFNFLKLNIILSEIIDVPLEKVKAAMNPNGILRASGLIKLGGYTAGSLKFDDITVMSSHFINCIVMSGMTVDFLLKGLINGAERSHLTWADYSHVQAKMDVLKPYLKKSLTTGKKGVNVFIYGKPGTGKTQLARLLGEHLFCDMYEVSTEDDEGTPASITERIEAYSSAQHFFKRRQTVLIFDEVDHVFTDGYSFSSSKHVTNRKSWLNKSIENNSVPTIWLANSVEDIDAAFVRRFDMVFELEVPPKHKRMEILKAHGGKFLTESELNELADCNVLSPAVVSRAADVIKTLESENETYSDQSIAQFESLIYDNLKAQGYEFEVCLAEKKRKEGHIKSVKYSTDYINSDFDLTQLHKGMKKHSNARLCLYGPPGTGKTAYVHHLASLIDKPVVAKKVSDLVSKWVGESEKNIAKAFNQAKEDDAILLIDEADSFFRSRSGAYRSWEVTQVNEMLSQLEAFTGLFVATTNMMDQFDSAAMRRFDMKVRFDYLNFEQLNKLFQMYCHELGLGMAGDLELQKLAQMKVVTPGDFYAISRRHRFMPIKNSLGLLKALESECQHKEPPKSIGFVS